MSCLVSNLLACCDDEYFIALVWGVEETLRNSIALGRVGFRSAGGKRSLKRQARREKMFEPVLNVDVLKLNIDSYVKRPTKVQEDGKILDLGARS